MYLSLGNLLFYSLATIYITGLPINHECESVKTFKTRMDAILKNMSDQQLIGGLEMQLNWYGKAIKLENEAIRLEKELASKCDELQKLRPFFAIRKWIETQEAFLAPEYGDPRAIFKDMRTRMDYHEEKWRKILEKTNVPMVQTILKLLQDNRISKGDFCRIVGGFFSMANGGINAPTLGSYTSEQMESILRDEYEIYDDTTIHCITRVLMKS
ncbi:uncharacterized protein LOC135847850 [Planococcus citri]|uniref:uncharacterized protein LOC135847850 n=1 Tax=Planococcus citri TaxID=170843 RepID=UPI0031F78DCA